MYATVNPSTIHRVLFIRTDRLGETLLNLPAIVTLKRAFPHASLTFLVQPELASLFQDVSDVNHVITCAPDAQQSWWGQARALAQVLKPLQFDVAVISNSKKELHLAVWLAGIRWRVGYARKLGRWLLTHRLQDRKALGERHEVEYNLDLVRALGLPSSIPQWGYPRLVHEQVEVQRLLEQQGIRPSDPFIAVHPWASNPLKRWPLERYAALIRYARERLAVQVVMIGGPEEATESQSLPRAVPVANLTGRLTLRQLAALLQCARLLVSNDSGPVHLAACVSTRTLVLFGTPNPANGPHRWGPWGNGHCVIWRPSMDEITIDEVREALTQMLRGSE